MSPNPKDRRELSLKAKLSLPETSAPPWSLVSAALTAVALLISLIVVGPALASLLLDSQEVTPFLLMLSWALGMALAVVFVIFSRRSSAESWNALRLGAGNLPRPIVLLIGVAIALAIDLLVSLASGRFLPVPAIFGFQSQGAASLILAAFLLILLQPLAESLVFQAILLPSLRWTLGPWGGVFATSALFVALHLLVYWAAFATSYDFFWYGIIYPGLTGLSFCLLRVFTASSSAVVIGRMGAGLIFLLTALVIFGG